MLKIQTIDNFIIFLMFALLPLDMLNGFLLHRNINLPISVAQLYKIVIIILFIIRFFFKPEKLVLIIICIVLLMTPSLVQVFKQGRTSFLFSDFIKLMRYLMPLLSFLFFVDIIKTKNIINIKKSFRLVLFSYVILVLNIFIKYIGFGYPMYEFGNIGSKGYFYAGNEISVLLVILSAIIGVRLWQNNKKIWYYLFLVLNLATGVAISSKTGMFGILLVFFLIPIKFSLITINLKRLRILLFSIIILFPVLIIYSWRYIQTSVVFVRLQYFWGKFDFLTFILSNRNNFFKRAYRIYLEEYSFLEKIIGVGQNKYEILNGNKIVEIDIIDIFFAYGFIGLFLFLFIMTYLWLQVKRFQLFKKYIFANFVLVMMVILLVISTMAGHVFSSGMSAIFIGLLFSLMYLKKNELQF